MIIPGGVLTLLALAAYESRKRRAHHTGPTLSGAYADEVTAFFYGTKRIDRKSVV